jgi:hypothetical protein
VIKRLVFLSRNPPLKNYARDFGINYLHNRGFEVIFLDLSYLVDGIRAQHSTNIDQILSNYEAYSIKTIEEFERFVDKNSPNTIYVDYIYGVSEYNSKSGRIYRALKKFNANYYIVSDGDIPSFHFKGNDSIELFCSQIRKIISNPSVIAKFIIRKLVISMLKNGILYQRPTRIFGIQYGPAIASYIKKLNIKNSQVIPINSRDYDRYVEYIHNHQLDSCSEDICTFIDEDLTNHPDFVISGIPPLDKIEYSSSMNRFFDLVEKITGIPVVVAAHPKSRFSSDRHPYGERAFIKGNTIQLVSRSRIVIAHSSTSISFPVLLKKPILLVINNEITNNKYILNSVMAFAAALQVKPVNIDCYRNSNKVSLEGHYCTECEDYLYKYVQNKDPVTKSIWEIVADFADVDLTQCRKPDL